MITFGNAIKIAGVSCVLIGLATGADAANAGRSKAGAPVKVAVASDEPSSSVAEAIAPVAKVVAAPVASVPGCARKVKVVYAGYGEADRASGCSVTSASATP